MACEIDHTAGLPKKQMMDLEDSQAGFWRHKCAGCAYEMGRRDAGAAEARLRGRVQQLMEENERLKKALLR